MNRAPVAVTPPHGEQFGPARAAVELRRADDGLDYGWLVVTDRDGAVLVDEPLTEQQVTEGRTRASVFTAAGLWQIRDLCSCSSTMKRWRREWFGTPRVSP